MSVQLIFNENTINNNDYQWINDDFINDSWVNLISNSGLMNSNIISNTMTNGNVMELSDKTIRIFTISNKKSNSDMYTTNYVSVNEDNANIQVVLFNVLTNEVITLRPTETGDAKLHIVSNPILNDSLLTLQVYKKQGNINEDTNEDSNEDSNDVQYGYTEFKIKGSLFLPDYYKLMTVQLVFDSNSINNNSFIWSNSDFEEDMWITDLPNSGELNSVVASNTMTYGDKIVLTNNTYTLYKISNKKYNNEYHDDHVIVYTSDNNVQVVLFDIRNNSLVTFRPNNYKDANNKLNIEYIN